MGEVLAEKIIDPDIEAILNETSLNWLRATDAYRLGFIEGQLQNLDNALLNIVQPAELLYHSLLRVISKEDIIQHRIGADYTTGVSTVLSIVSQRVEDSLPTLQDMAKTLELFVFRNLGCDCNFWVTTDRDIEQSLIDQDFPCCRGVV